MVSGRVTSCQDFRLFLQKTKTGLEPQSTIKSTFFQFSTFSILTYTWPQMTLFKPISSSNFTLEPDSLPKMQVEDLIVENLTPNPPNPINSKLECSSTPFL